MHCFLITKYYKKKCSWLVIQYYELWLIAFNCFVCFALQLDVVGHIDTLIILLSPRQVHLLLDLFGAFSGGGDHPSVILFVPNVLYQISMMSPNGLFRNGANRVISYSLCEGAQEWAKDRKSRPMQQEDEYRLHMELNRCLKKDTAVPGTDPDLFESQTTRTVSSRGKHRPLTPELSEKSDVMVASI